MAYKQPRVPQKQPGMSQEEYLRALTLFLKDFCMETWTAVTRGKKDGGEGGKGTVTSVNGEAPDESGNVQLAVLTSDPREVEEAPELDAVPINADRLGGKSLQDIMLTLYPVGSIYTSIDSTSPASLFGGVWEQLKDRFLLGAGDSYAEGSVGGEAEHTLTVDEMPRHNHTVPVDGDGNYTTELWEPRAHSYCAPGTKTLAADTARTGGGKTHNNMPPYLAVYMWKRVS